MEEIDKLQYISLCSKVSNDIFAQIGVKDKVLTEYVIEQAIEATDENNFIEKMNEDESGFSLQFCVSLWKNVSSMMTQGLLKKKKAQSNTTGGGSKEFVGGSSASNTGALGWNGDKNSDNIASNPDVSKEELSQRFPGLAMKNKNDEEMELDLDDLDVKEPEKPESNLESKIDEALQKQKVKRKTDDSDDEAGEESPKEETKRKDKETSHRDEERGRKDKYDHERKDKKHKRRNYSRSYSRDSTRSRDRKRHKDSKSRNHDKRRRSRSRSTERSEHPRDRHDRKYDHKKSRRKYSDDIPINGRIYDGYVTRKLKDGVLVQLSDWRVGCDLFRTAWKVLFMSMDWKQRVEAILSISSRKNNL